MLTCYQPVQPAMGVGDLSDDFVQVLRVAHVDLAVMQLSAQFWPHAPQRLVILLVGLRKTVQAVD